ncbi:MAG: LysM peptidoglycan-binding domain-containing protein, partial [Deinococcus sp.]|nr:LysM peptidoglycan-binding domain-containing protein [Deinococcus sp.]
MRALIVVLLLVMGLAKAQESYTVQPGDTLFSIARRYGTTLAQLAEINGIADPSKITAGQVLRLPADAPAFQRVPLMA